MAESKAQLAAATGEMNEDDKEIQQGEVRENWSGKLDFILSCIGYAVGLGNVWRFPYLCYKYGGGAFLIPYMIMMAFCGLPLLLLEIGVGQFCSLGPITMWRVSPVFKGLGWAMMFVSVYMSIYYNVIISWVIHYFFGSMTDVLPWSVCKKGYSALCNESPTNNLSSYHFFNSSHNPNGTFFVSGVNKTTYENLTMERNQSLANCSDITSSETSNCSLTAIRISMLELLNLKLTSPAQEYFDKVLLQKSSGIDDSGEPLWDLALCLLLAWVVVFLCIVKGVKSSGKVVYFTAVFPYVMLTVFVIYGALLPGASAGIEFYLKPDFSKLLQASIWKDAAGQVFYSMSIGFGGLHTMASYNKFKNNILRDVLVVTVFDFLTSIYAGFAVFSMIGYIANRNGLKIEDAVTSGPGLAFVAYPDGIATLPIPQLWSVLFFVMLFTLGLDSQFATCEGVVTGLVDEFPVLRKTKWRRIGVTATFCGLMFILGLSMTTKAGVYWFTLFDEYAVNTSVCIIAIFEIIAIIYTYGVNRFIGDLNQMLGIRNQSVWWFFKACWCAVTPALLMFIFIYRFVDYAPVKYESYSYPQWAEVIGWMMVVSSAIQIPVWALIIFCKYNGLHTMCLKVLYPADTWGPALPGDRAVYNSRHDVIASMDLQRYKLAISQSSATMASQASIIPTTFHANNEPSHFNGGYLADTPM